MAVGAECLHARLGELFVRAEPRRQAGLYLEGLLSAVERKNGWQLAEHLGDARPWRTQRLLLHVQWDLEAARACTRRCWRRSRPRSMPSESLHQTHYRKHTQSCYCLIS